MCGQPLEIQSMDSFSESPKLADSQWSRHAYSWVRSLSANSRVTVDKRFQATCDDERGPWTAAIQYGAGQFQSSSRKR